jgi:transcription elongation GreA/GreB family factor
MNNTNAERQARWRQRQKARAEEQAQAQARIAELEAALKQARAIPSSKSSDRDPINAITPAVVTPAVAP